jgi:hypothetical protein
MIQVPVPAAMTPSLTPTQKTSWLKHHRKLLLAVTGTVVLATSGGVLAWRLMQRAPEPAPAVVQATPTPTPTPTPAPVTKLSPLTGLPVSPELADRPIVSIVIENHPAARPQSGLSDAGVVYEALAEGGITRFQTFFLDNRPASIGPVRSLRPYFVDWGLEFNAPVAHAGGSSTALDLVKPLGMKDINALSFGSSGFFRIGTRAAPHNLYSSTAKLDPLLSRLGFAGASSFTVSPRKADAPTATPPHPNIHIEYSYSGYQVDYKYDPTTNDYTRSLSGAPHIDSNTGKQIHVKNVVVEMMPTSTLADGHMQMQTVGQGQGWVLRDGDAIACTWVKDSHSARTRLLDAAGADIPLNAGNTWYSIVPTGKKVSF